MGLRMEIVLVISSGATPKRRRGFAFDACEPFGSRAAIGSEPFGSRANFVCRRRGFNAYGIES